MASDDNLIDFSAEDDTLSTQNESGLNMPRTSHATNVSTPIHTTSHKANDSLNNAANTSMQKMDKPNKSLFAITREETTHGISRGEESEFDDTLSETHDSSSTSILENISRNSESDERSDSTISQPAPENEIDRISPGFPLDITEISVVLPSTPNALVNTIAPLPSTQYTTMPTTLASTSTSTSQATEPQSRFRIVKISKAKPYDKGKWVINDFSDSQKQKEPVDVTDNTNSPATKARTKGNGSNGDSKQEKTKTVTSPVSEPVKTQSNESIVQSVLSTTQSRGSSYNNVVTERTSAVPVDSTYIGGQSTHVVPVLEALDTAMDQIQHIRDAITQSVNDEMQLLRNNMAALLSENNKLKDENSMLKQKLTATEERLRALDKG